MPIGKKFAPFYEILLNIRHCIYAILNTPRMWGQLPAHTNRQKQTCNERDAITSAVIDPTLMKHYSPPAIRNSVPPFMKRYTNIDWNRIRASWDICVMDQRGLHSTASRPLCLDHGVRVAPVYTARPSIDGLAAMLAYTWYQLITIVCQNHQRRVIIFRRKVQIPD